MLSTATFRAGQPRPCSLLSGMQDNGLTMCAALVIVNGFREFLQADCACCVLLCKH